MAMALLNEDDFQVKFVSPKLRAVGHVWDHRYSALPDVPDMSCGAHGVDYWLELKYGKFKLGHDKYDDFYFRETTRGQLQWLVERARTGKAICGILGYMNCGEHAQYLVFMTGTVYLEWVWQKKLNAGAVILSEFSTPAASVLTGRDLLSFIGRAAAATQPKRRALCR